MNGGVNFNDFMQKQLQGGKMKQVQQAPLMMGNMNAPIIKPEHQKEFQKSLSMHQTPSQVKQL
jgi:hypothetical protein